MDPDVIVENIESKKSLFSQIWKFSVIGVMNTTINFLVFNTLSFLTGITKGDGVIILTAISFSVATINSYFFNKYWAFKDKSKYHEGQKFTLFLLVSFIGASINSSIVWYITNHISPMYGLSPRLWANAALIVATGASLVWNFIGYKWIVFKK